MANFLNFCLFTGNSRTGTFEEMAPKYVSFVPLDVILERNLIKIDVTYFEKTVNLILWNLPLNCELLKK